MRIPSYYELHKPTLELMKNGNIYNHKDLIFLLKTKLQLAPEILELKYESKNGYIFADRVGWSLSYLSMAGLVTRPKRGHYQITKLGQQLAGQKAENIAKFIKQKMLERKQNEDISAEQPIEMLPTEQTPKNQLELAYQTIRQAVYDEILDTILNKTASEFEKLTVELLQKMGYGNGQVTQLSRDGGIDGVINGDALGFERIFIQAKRYQKENYVTAQEVRAFAGSLLSAKHQPKGVFITTSRYTKDAVEYVKDLAVARIVLIDGITLAKYIYDYDLGMQVEQTLSIKRLDADFWDELQNESIS